MGIDDGDDRIDPTIVLKGLFPLPKLIRFVRERCPPQSIDEAALIDDWRQARMVASGIIRDEAGFADDIDVHPLPDEMTAIAERVLDLPAMRRRNALVSQSWCMVEVDRLTVFQESINLRHARRLKASLPSTLDAGRLMELASCTGAHAHPEVRVTQSDGEYVFASESNDLRFLDVAAVRPDAIACYEPFGTACHALAIYVGFSDNMISATRFGNRIVMTNGTHRAYVLRELGFRHIPCLLTDASDADAFDMLSPAAIKQDRQFYLNAPRPPLFKDYVDPRLTQTVPVTRKTYVLRAKMELQRIAVPGL